MPLRCNEIKNSDFVDKEVRVRGWVHRLRKQKENTFILIRDDRGGIIQAIFPTSKSSILTIESSIEVIGVLHQDSRAPEGGYEIKGHDLIIFSIAQTDFPIGEYQSPELLLDYRHLALRTRRMVSIAKIRASVLKFARNWFLTQDWTEITAPVLVKGAVEGGSTLFKVRYFDEDAYLSQSAQLYLEAMIFCLGPVWSLTPSFRAEKSRTVRHLAEFSHLEAEAPWVDLEDILKVQEELVTYIIHNLAKERAEELNLLKRDIAELKNVQTPFERMSYDKAIEKLRSAGYKIEIEGSKRTIEWGDDLSIDSERALTHEYTNPVFVIGYPLHLKPFYVKQEIGREGITLSADMLAPQGFGEIISGGIREDVIEVISKRIKDEGLDPSTYNWYLDLRRYGSVPHGGFGLGIERLTRWITHIEDIKDTVLFPRTISRIMP
jgi:asparaginyl-tRNA synthetase